MQRRHHDIKPLLSVFVLQFHSIRLSRHRQLSEREGEPGKDSKMPIYIPDKDNYPPKDSVVAANVPNVNETLAVSLLSLLAFTRTRQV